MPDKRPLQGIATDGAHSSKNGVTEYRGIDLATGNQVFYCSLGNKTVNVGEFLGVVAAVKYILENDYSPRIVYTDSMTAISWFQNKKTASQKNYIDLLRAECFLKIMAMQVDTIKVVHWKNDLWGEIPADFGRK